MGATTTLQGSDFNPRAPCGARLLQVDLPLLLVGISIHAPRVGRDLYEECLKRLVDISIHAPRVGRDLVRQHLLSEEEHFNPRAPCGARQAIWCFTPVCRHFNPRAPCGARHFAVHALVGNDLNFNPRAPCGARLQQTTNYGTLHRFQSTRPVWGATVVYVAILHLAKNFNPRAPCGARLRKQQKAACRKTEFQSTRPVWGATVSTSMVYQTAGISIHAPRVGRDRGQSVHHVDSDISIHAPRVGRDQCSTVPFIVQQNFNPRAPCGARLFSGKTSVGNSVISIHAPRVGRDCSHVFFSFQRSRFQSTRPVWGATPFASISLAAFLSFQSTRPVWGATQWVAFKDMLTLISIHAPRVGRDYADNTRLSTSSDFNPRAPCGARQAIRAVYVRSVLISIHAPRVGRDTVGVLFRNREWISIHAPRVGRDQRVSQYCAGVNAFQSTRPVWGATIAEGDHKNHFAISIHAPRVGRDLEFLPKSAEVRISIHAPRVGRDRQQATVQYGKPNFNPRAPCGARRVDRVYRKTVVYFNPRAPCGARHQKKVCQYIKKHFNPRAPCGARPHTFMLPPPQPHFNPRAPCGARQQI